MDYKLVSTLISSIVELNVYQNKTKYFRCHFNPDFLANDSFKLYGVFPSKDILKSVPKRQAEFIAGRFCAQLGLKELGVLNRTVSCGEGRAPLWPNGVKGSISHTGDVAEAIVSMAPDVVSLGIDIEKIFQKDIARYISDQIVNKKELSLINSLPICFETFLTIVFSAKESLFKAIYPLVEEYFDFRATILVNIKQNTLSLMIKRKFRTVDFEKKIFNVEYTLSEKEVRTVVVLK